MKTLIKNILTDIKTDLADEVDRNFERQAFFTDKWEKEKLHNHKGSLMQRTGKLRRSCCELLSNFCAFAISRN